jgi:hypothetical protein
VPRICERDRCIDARIGEASLFDHRGIMREAGFRAGHHRIGAARSEQQGESKLPPVSDR